MNPMTPVHLPETAAVNLAGTRPGVEAAAPAASPGP